MPKLIRTLWFESTGPLNEPIFETPVGKFTIRQIIIFTISAILGYLVGSAVVHIDFTTGLLSGAGIFIVGFFIATEHIKTISPEMSVYYMIRRPPIGVQSPKAKSKKKEEAPDKPVISKEITASIMGDVGRPVTIIHTLKDERGQLLPSTPFSLIVNGQEVGSGVSDAAGSFAIHFRPPGMGKFVAEILPDKHLSPTEKFIINVQQRG